MSAFTVPPSTTKSGTERVGIPRIKGIEIKRKIKERKRWERNGRRKAIDRCRGGQSLQRKVLQITVYRRIRIAKKETEDDGIKGDADWKSVVTEKMIERV